MEENVGVYIQAISFPFVLVVWEQESGLLAFPSERSLEQERVWVEG